MRRTWLASALLACMFLASEAMAGSANFTFRMEDPTSCLLGYRLYYSRTSGQYDSINSVALPFCNGCLTPGAGVAEWACSMVNFQPGATYYFTVTALNAQGESPRSNEVSKTMPLDTCPVGNIALTPASSATRVDGYDLIKFGKEFGKRVDGANCTLAAITAWTGSSEAADLNSDRIVDGVDQNILMANRGKICGQ